MNAHAPSRQAAAREPEHFDVLIVGAGISGIGSAYHLQQQCPGMRFAVLDAMESYGGTWLIHRYPGTRSDSDLFTFGYRFKPWTGAPIASRDQILTYLGEVIEENQLAAHIRYRHAIASASWCSETNLWTLQVQRTDSGETITLTTRFLWMCQGYYRHAKGYTPDWPAMESFQGRIIHPQQWPEDLDCSGKHVVVVGSGATAATLVPALAKNGAQVTLLQRSPTYFSTGRNADALCDELRKLEVDDAWIHEIMRRKVVKDRDLLRQRAGENPQAVTQQLLAGVQAALGPDFDISTHFTPRYRPMQQRIAFVPDGDLFQAIRSGQATVVTDEIATFTETGVRLQSGQTLDADIVVSATGFQLSVLGDIRFSIDGKTLDFSQTVTYRGMMFTGIPNLVWLRGYSFYSWTLRADIIGDFVCRLLQHMQRNQALRVVPRLRASEKDMELSAWDDPKEFNPGYLLRGLHLLPKRGTTPEWRHCQDYTLESALFPAIDLADEVFDYGYGPQHVRAQLQPHEPSIAEGSAHGAAQARAPLFPAF